MADKEFKPYVPEKTSLREFTFKAIFLGAIMSIILGAANAYVGLKVGMTVAATFPAAVIAMAVLRIFKGSILEENTCRTTAAVGEALVAGAIFTIPAFLIFPKPIIWTKIKYWESTLIMLIGGVLGVLFVIFLRRILIEDTELPFPESVAVGEIVKSGQKGGTGAKYVFGSLGLAALIQLFKHEQGIQVIKEYFDTFVGFAKSKIQLLNPSDGSSVGTPADYSGGIYLRSPAASPILLGVGYIIGPRLAAIVFSGGVLAWWLMVPLALFMDRGLEGLAGSTDWITLSKSVWFSQVRPIAVGAMLVGAVYTLFKMRKSLTTGISRAIKDMRKVKMGDEETPRLQKDLSFKKVIPSIVLLIIPIFLIYWYFSRSIGGAIIAAIVMTIAGFFFAAVAGYLVGTIGASNNPISGLTLSTLIIAALLMALIKLKGEFGIAATLGVAAVVCCACGVAGEIMQDLKVGHILGGTPWKMELACIIGVIAAALVLVVPMNILHLGTEGGIGGEGLPAPQAGLMKMLAVGIIQKQMPWPLILVGMMLSLGLILIKSPSPMLIAVGMYLPFETTAAIFVGGIIKYIIDKVIAAKKVPKAKQEKAENTGILIASGLIAGEAIMGILLAAFVVFKIELPKISENPYLGLIIFAIVTLILIYFPLKALRGERKESA